MTKRKQSGRERVSMLLTCTSLAHALLVRSPCVFSSANCAASLASVQAQSTSVPEHQAHVVFQDDSPRQAVFTATPHVHGSHLLYSQAAAHLRWTGKCRTRHRCPGSHPSVCTQSSLCGPTGTAAQEQATLSTSHYANATESTCPSQALPYAAALPNKNHPSHDAVTRHDLAC